MERQLTLPSTVRTSDIPVENEVKIIKYIFEAGSSRHNWATLSLGDVSRGTCFSSLKVGCKADHLAVENKIVAKSKEIETGRNLPKHAREEHGTQGLFANDDENDSFLNYKTALKLMYF
jgi:hypothetical protein